MNFLIFSNAKMTSTVATTNVPSGIMTPLTLKRVLAASTGNVSVNKPAAFPSNKTAAKLSAVASAAAAAAQSSGSTFAAVASGSGTDSFGMIQTGGTHPGTLAKANNNKKAKTPEIGKDY